MRRERSHVLPELRRRGFDLSRYAGAGRYAVRCSQCEALVVSGVAVHERGCPHERHECRGCRELVSRAGAWCAECAS